MQDQLTAVSAIGHHVHVSAHAEHTRPAVQRRTVPRARTPFPLTLGQRSRVTAGKPTFCGQATNADSRQ